MYHPVSESVFIRAKAIELKRTASTHGKRADALIDVALNKFLAYKLRHMYNHTYKEIGSFFGIGIEPARQYVLYVERRLREN